MSRKAYMKNFLLSFLRGKAPFYQAILFPGVIGSCLWFGGYRYVMPKCCSEWSHIITESLQNDVDFRWLYYSALQIGILFSYAFFALFCLWQCSRSLPRKNHIFLARLFIILLALLLVIFAIMMVASVAVFGS
jgi:hypothetical protein